ncbi:hypothetical protein RUND412_008167 [Rhizina undulata]
MALFAGNQAKISAGRGPFATSAAWIKCLLNYQIASLDLELYGEHPKMIKDDGEDGNVDDEDEDEAKELKGMLEAIKQLSSLVPKRVVDWECVSAQQLWKARRYPQSLRGPEVSQDQMEAEYGSPIIEILPPPNEDDVETTIENM